MTSSVEPPKNSLSVRIEQAEAPPKQYDEVTTSGRASRLIHPFEGDLRLNSAMMPVGDSSNDLRNERQQPSTLSSRANNDCILHRSFARATSSRLCATIV